MKPTDSTPNPQSVCAKRNTWRAVCGLPEDHYIHHLEPKKNSYAHKFEPTEPASLNAPAGTNPFSKGYTHRHGEPVSDACGEGKHSECTQDLTKCHCTFRGGHSVMHAYMNPPMTNLAPAGTEGQENSKMKMKIEIELEYSTHWDTQSGVEVADIPALGLKTQAKPENIERAAKSAAQMWLQLCLDRGTILNWKRLAHAPAPAEHQGVQAIVNVFAETKEQLEAATVRGVRGTFAPEVTPKLEEGQGEQLQKVYDYFMGPHACGNFTCSCNKPDVCGICELRQETEDVLRSATTSAPYRGQLSQQIAEAVLTELGDALGLNLEAYKGRITAILRPFITPASTGAANIWPDLIYGDKESWCGKYTRNGESNSGGNIGAWYANAVFWRNRAEGILNPGELPPTPTSAPQAATPEKLIVYPAIPVYLSDPLVFQDAKLGTAMAAMWNSEQWIFRVHNGQWCSVRPANSDDPVFVDPINKTPELDTCPGCTREDAPHFAKCNKAPEPSKRTFDPSEVSKVVPAPATPTESVREGQPDCDCGAGNDAYLARHAKTCALAKWAEPKCPHCGKGPSSPSVPLLDVPAGGKLTTDELLVILMEECAEVIKAASKCIRFGWDREQPEYGQNDKVLAGEIGDLLGIMDALPLDGALVEYCRRRKLAKAEKAKEQFGRNAALSSPRPAIEEKK